MEDWMEDWMEDRMKDGMKDGMEDEREEWEKEEWMKENGRREWEKRTEEEKGRKWWRQIWQGVKCPDTADSSWKEVKFDAAVGEKQEGREIERKFSVNLQDKRKLNGNHGKYEV